MVFGLIPTPRRKWNFSKMFHVLSYSNMPPCPGSREWVLLEQLWDIILDRSLAHPGTIRQGLKMTALLSRSRGFGETMKLAYDSHVYIFNLQVDGIIPCITLFLSSWTCFFLLRDLHNVPWNHASHRKKGSLTAVEFCHPMSALPGSLTMKTIPKKTGPDSCFVRSGRWLAWKHSYGALSNARGRRWFQKEG